MSTPVLPSPCARRLVKGFATALLVTVGVVAVHAQVTVSNLSQGADSSRHATSTGWIAQSFTTDATQPSYTLDSVTLMMASSFDSSGNFFVKLYSNGSGVPGAAMETLNGTPNPATAGNYSFTSAGTTLNAITTYWIVAGVNSGSGDYRWSTTPSGGETSTGASWTIGDFPFVSTNSGSSFSQSTGPLLLTVATTSAIPESGTSAALAGLTALGLVAWRRRKREATTEG